MSTRSAAFLERHRGWMSFCFLLCLSFVLAQFSEGCSTPPSEAPPQEQGEKEPVVDQVVTPDGGGKDSSPKDQTGDQSPKDDGKVETKPLDQPLNADEARTGQISKDSERILGPDATSQIGDWKLYNSKVAFAIHGVGRSRFFSQASGHLIDASVVDGDGKATRDLLEEVFPGFGVIRVIQATKIEVLSPGGPGKAASLRVTATDVGIPVIDAALRSKSFSGKIEVDYVLQPGATHLEITTRLLGGDRINDLQMGDGLLLGDRTKLFAPLVGFDTENVVSKPIKWFGSIGEGASYLIAPADPQGVLRIPITQAAVYPAFGGVATSDEDKSEYKRFFFVGDGRFEAMLDALRAIHPADGLKRIDGTIQGLANPEKATVLLRTKEGLDISQTRPDTKGAFQFQAPDGSYQLVAQMEGHTQVKQDVTLGQSHSLAFTPGGILKLTIKEKDPAGNVGGFVPVRVELTGPSSILVDVISPTQEIPVPPGKYTVTVSRGLAYEYWQKELTFQPEGGKPAVVTQDVELQRVVDLTGYVGSDMHLHASPSADSELPLEQRITALVAEGLHFAVSTDHDVFTDYTPIIQKLGLTAWIRTAIGQEVSPIPFHINTYPLASIPTDENRYFGVGWAVYENREYVRTMTGPEIWAQLRKKYNAQIIQINHPRSSQAFLGAIGYDPKKGISALEKGVFDSNWDAIEVYNAKRRDNFLNENIFDWFSFHNQGWHKTAVGNSDSHGAGARPGMPRTLIASSTQQSDKIDINELVKSLKENKAIVYGGPFIKVQTDKGEGPGARVSGAAMELQIEILAPSWVPVSYVKIFANGELFQKFDVTASTQPSRFKQTVQLKPSKDTWYVILAGDDDKEMTVVYPGIKPVSMTNPIFLDIDGNGFQAPGLTP